MSDATYNYGNVFQGMSNISEHEITQLLHLLKLAGMFHRTLFVSETSNQLRQE